MENIRIEEHQGEVYITIPSDENIVYGDLTRYVKSLGIEDIDYAALKRAYSQSRGEDVRLGKGSGKSDKMESSQDDTSSIAVEVSHDGHEAFVTLYSEKIEEPITYRKITDALKSNGVKRGFLTENINRAVEEKSTKEKIKVAEWIPPMDGMDAELTYHFPEHKDLLACILDTGPDVPFEKINFIRKVKMGNVIISKIPPVKGVPGCKVTGEKIPFQEGREINIEGNEYLTVSSDGSKALAAVDGQIVIDKEGRVSIRPLLVLKKTSGDKKIKFDGSILIEGDLSYCPGISATGDIEVNGNSQNVPVTARGNIFIKGAFLLYGEKQCKVLRDFACATTSSTSIKARNIYVEKSVSQSILEAEEEVHTSAKEGRVIGGEIQAGKRVVVGELGNKKETDTTVKVATIEIQKKLNELRKEKIGENLKKIKEEVNVSKEAYLKLDQERRVFEDGNLPPGMEGKIRLAKERRDALQKELDRLKTELVQCKHFKPEGNLGEVVCQFVHAGVKLEMGHSTREIRIPIESPVRFLKKVVGIVTEMKDLVKKEEKDKYGGETDAFENE